MNKILFCTLIVMVCGCSFNGGHIHTTSTYTLHWNEVWGLRRHLGGLSYSECLNYGYTMYSVDGYRCVGENRSQHYRTRVHLRARARIGL